MFDYTGKTALITGASMGIGAVFARELAARGMNLILVARSADKLTALGVELKQKHRIRAEVIAIDLTRENVADEIRRAVENLQMTVDVLVNNAGFGTHGKFHELDARTDHAEIMLNVTTLVDLTHVFLPAMVAKGAGGVINVASIAAFQPLPYMAVYGATKAFVLSFSEALWAENRANNVRVLALCPGPVDTPFFATVGTEDAAVGSKDTPENVVRQGLRAFERNKNYIIPRTNDWLLAQTSRFSPRSLVVRLTKHMMRPGKSPGLTASAQTPKIQS